MIYVQYKEQGEETRSLHWTGQAIFNALHLSQAGLVVSADEKEAAEIVEVCCGLRSLRHGGMTVWTGDDALFILNNFAADK